MHTHACTSCRQCPGPWLRFEPKIWKAEVLTTSWLAKERMRQLVVFGDISKGVMQSTF